MSHGHRGPRSSRNISVLELIAPILLVLCLSGPALLAQHPPGHGSQAAHQIVQADTVSWGPGPPALPPGAQAAILHGDPSKPGLFVLRLKLPDGYKVPPHWHPSDEHITVFQGTFLVGMGDGFDAGALKPINTGGYAFMPSKTNHFAQAKGETILQVHGMGPFMVTFVNPADDPRPKAPSGGQ